MTRGRIQTQTITVTIANGQSTANGATNTLNGIIRAVNINAPAMTGASYTFAVTGPASSFTLFSKASLSPNTVSNLVADGTNLPTNGVAVDASTGVSITSAGTEGAQRVFTVTLLIDR